MSCDLGRGRALAAAAAQYIGVRFQLHGRDPRQGLDCIGLLSCSLLAIGCDPVIPYGYTLRNSDPMRWIDCARQSGLATANSAIEAGDILLTKPGPGQHHLMIVEDRVHVIHAHAGLRRIVREPMQIGQSWLAHWRLF